MAVNVQGYSADTYGARWVDEFTRSPESSVDRDSCIDFLSQLARPGPVLELGVGTGRIALALARSGLDVHGIDVSLPMLEVLRQQDASITAWCADMAHFAARKQYRLVYAVGNALFMLRSAAEQKACLYNVRDVLAENGAFVVETVVPDLAAFTNGQLLRIEEISADRVDLLLARHNTDRQEIAYQRVTFTDMGTARLRPLVYRYVEHVEMDAMATQAGLAMSGQWADWTGNPYNDGRRRVVRYQPEGQS